MCITFGTVPDSTSERWLVQQRIRRRAYDSVEDALQGLARGECAAVVYDHPLLAYHVRRDEILRDELTVLPGTFAPQDYAVALPPESGWRERVNRELLKHLASPFWDELVARYLGP